MKVCQDCVFSMFSVLILLNPLNMFSMFSSPGALNLLNIPFIGAEVFAVVCICENSGRPDPILTLLYSINSPSQSIAPTEVVFLAIASP